MSGRQANQIVDKSSPVGPTEETPISVNAVQPDLTTSKQETRGSYTGGEPQADDAHRMELAQKDKYPLRMGPYEVTDNLSNEEKEKRSQAWAGESDPSGERRDMKEHLSAATSSTWADSNIPFSSLSPEKTTGTPVRTHYATGSCSVDRIV